MRQLGLEPLGDNGGYLQVVPTKGEGRTWNAVGRLSGRDRSAASEAVLLSAHFDHLGNRSDRAGAPADAVYNGADDDASGTVAVLQLMEALARSKRPRRTVIFALFGSEERGGLGSRHFAANPPVPLRQIVANLQFEMIGRPDAKVPPESLWLTGYERSTLGSALARRGARLVQDPYPEMKFFFRSDNIHFARQGIVAHTVSSYGLHKEYHTPLDDIAHIDFTHMTEAIRSFIEPVRWLANSTFRPQWKEGMQPAAAPPARGPS
jgi:Zn-dependent M28 family amino/carboxypeptidase